MRPASMQRPPTRTARIATTLLLSAALGVACGCGSAPPIPTAQRSDVLDDARLALDAERLEDAEALLDQLDRDELPLALRERHVVLSARVALENGDRWDAFKLIRTFADDYRFSNLAGEVEQLHFRIGSELVRTGSHWWIFQSDRDDGAIVLREFIERYPSSRRAADALRDLGELAFTDEEWLLAQRRFREIVEFHPTSEWVTLARFRMAITAYRYLEGPEYDVAAMRRARNELAAFLDPPPENPDFANEAQTALVTVEDWLAQRHWIDAKFYRTLKKPVGERFHLNRLLAEFPNHPAAADARLRLAELDTADAAANASAETDS